MVKLFICVLTFAFSSTAFAEVRIVATTSDLAAIAKEVGGDRVSVTTLSQSTEDPHYVDPRPDKILALNKANLLMMVGLELESGWLPALQKEARNSSILKGSQGHFVASEVVELKDVNASADRSRGDVHRGGNPHFLFDPRSAMKVAIALKTRLSKVDPDGEKEYGVNVKKFNAALLNLAKKQMIRFRRVPEKSRNVVAYHRSLTYLFDWLALTEVATVEPKPGIPPNPKHLATVMAAMKKNDAHVIVQESYYPQKTAKTLAKITKGSVVVIRGGTHFPKETYIAHMTKICDEIYNAITK